MRRIFVSLGTLAVLAAAVAAPGAALATAAASPAVLPVDCAVQAVGTANTANQPDSRFTVNGNVVSGKFEVKGGPSCRATVTIATWEAPNGGKGQPYSEQKLFNHATDTFGPGMHIISTPLPNCFFQVDLLHGDKPTAPDGSPVYPKGVLMGSLHGGTQPCVSPTPTPSPSLSPTPQPPTPSPTPSTTPAVLGESTQPPLPQTGAELGGVVGLGSILSAGYAYLRSRKSLRDSLK